jgi:prevent-host-death family protein
MLISNIHSAKTNLSKLLEEVLAGKEVIIAKAGKPIAKIVAYTEKKKPRKLGLWKGKVWMSPDFNDEDPEINSMFYDAPLTSDLGSSKK